jgi:preprotein translocase subunit SecD
MPEPIKINSLTSLAKAISTIDAEWHEHKYLEVTIKRKAGQRTDQQRKAIEVYCRELANKLNEAGLDQRAVLARMREGVEIPWRQESVKESLWREIQKAVVNKESSAKLTWDEVSKVYDVLNRWTGGTLGVSVPFPEREKRNKIENNCYLP